MGISGLICSGRTPCMHAVSSPCRNVVTTGMATPVRSVWQAATPEDHAGSSKLSDRGSTSGSSEASSVLTAELLASSLVQLGISGSMVMSPGSSVAGTNYDNAFRTP